MAALEAEILAVGTEILEGDVLDTNTHFLARTVTGLGGRVARAAVAPDEPGPLEAEVRAALARRPGLLLTSGGLGPTEDDGTIAAVARAAGAPLEEHPAALALVRAAYDGMAAKGWVAEGGLTPARRKMALLPRGARPVENPAGAAPGVVLLAGATTVISLPGVPEELRGIVEGPLRPDLRALFGASVYREDLVLVSCNDESLLAPMLAAIAPRHPRVRVKSRARRFGPGIRIRVTLSARGDGEKVVRALLEDCADAVARACQQAGLAVETTCG